MKKRFLISAFTLFVALIMVLFFRFDDAKKLFRSLQEKRGHKPLKPIVIETDSADRTKEQKDIIPLKDQRRSVTERIPLDVNKIKEMRESGMTLQAIGDQMGVSASTISNRLKELEEKAE